MFFFPVDKDYSCKWDGYTLIMPAISVGNVGQLSVDIILSTTVPDRVGYIYDDSLLPIVGNDPFSSNDLSCKLTTCCDVYCADSRKLVVIQQRATFIKGKRRCFRENLVTWLKTQSFSKVVLMSSTFAHTRTDQQLQGTQFRYLAADCVRESLSHLPNWVELEDSEDEFGRTGKHIPGSGITKTLYADCDAANIPFIALLKFCSEGDNAPDALRLTNYANELLGIVKTLPRENTGDLKSIWKIPVSWRLNFGNRFNQIIFN